MPKTSPLVLDAMIVTGNTKAAVKAAGGGSSDLWTVPPDQIHYDPRDNVRPLDPDRVRHMANLIKVNGYDRKQPLGCFVRKVGGEDRIYVYAGQHRFHGALLAISEGAQIDRLPIVIDEAKSVNRANLIYAGITTNDGEKLTPLQLAEKVVELQELGESNATICQRLNITDQTIRDVLLLAHAPAALHKLVRDKVVSSTLAIDEIRTHGGEKALERLQSAAVQAKAGGKAKVTKKALTKPADDKITPPQAKQLLQALRAVQADESFGLLSMDTTTVIVALLDEFNPELLTRNGTAGKRDIPGPNDVVFVDELIDPIDYPLHATNEHGVFVDCERLVIPKFGKGNGLPTVEIKLAHPEPATWIYSVGFHLNQRGKSGPISLGQFVTTFPSRFKALCAARDELVAELRDPVLKRDKKTAAALQWLEDVVYAARQGLVDHARTQQRMADLAPLAKQVKAKTTPLHPAAAWPFPTTEEGRQRVNAAIEAREKAK
ncbi:hypothetical protein LMG24238_02967 [Paraburkholderia sediminicola]|uniref:Uncharacterized protein n=1 Tax=Paraburkholderia sediminicola TaxID=458836 RepID=A0A6J5B1X4_9BURK|nr:ParB N-terminal domain-containing protein [Paraburkholderia sediminicola]CAB3688067.1 hypothetical protein LMG24238_02967 [Paraburkholderia sediminicola]